MKINKIVIIGSSGFVGSNLIKKIKNNYIKKINSRNIDLLNKKKTFKKLPNIIKNSKVVFSAGRHRKYGDSITLKKKNLKIFKNFIDSCSINLPERVIFLSTVEVYGSMNKKKINEDAKINPANNYANGKIIQEKKLVQFCVKNNVKYYILRLPGFYGKKDCSSIVYKIISKIKSKDDFYWNTDGKELRDYIYIEDLVKIIKKFIFNNTYQSGVYNVVSGKSFSIRYYVNIISKLLKNKKIINYNKSKSGFDLKFDTYKLRLTLKKLQFNSHIKSIKKII
ncbi:SDR family oxidoreductase [Candidatus Pelagibacter sp.]|nr:SDR family oxidoreductase [Candidatus Pelagibacter sp.]